MGEYRGLIRYGSAAVGTCRVFSFPDCRVQDRYGDDYGAFLIEHRPTGAKLRVITSSGDKDIPWEHVSVSLPNRCPNWPEMAFIKDLFWLPTETVMQLHVPAEDHRNLHSYCLHLWRPINQEIPRPPNDAVAIAGDLNANRRCHDRLTSRLQAMTDTALRRLPRLLPGCTGARAWHQAVPGLPAYPLDAARRGTGLGIYEKRPPSCRGWRCGWLENEDWEDDLRPDRCGFIVDPELT